MALQVFSDEWARACCEQINRHAGYRDAAADWEYPVVLVLLADRSQGFDQDRAYFLDLYRGQCREVRPATAEDRTTAPFVLGAGPDAWRQILGGQTDPIMALMRGQLRLLRGNLMSLAKHAGAAKQLVAAAGEVDAEFPSAT